MKIETDMQSLKRSFESIQKANEEASELERLVSSLFNAFIIVSDAANGGDRLSPDELVVDLAQQRALVWRGEKRVASVHRNSHYSNLSMRLLHDRIKSETADTMEQNEIAVAAFNTDAIVRNFSRATRTRAPSCNASPSCASCR